ncbi:hypothetical protein ADZ36_11795 [Streptomyces fradiae]|uniref:Uncharacterized protein n=1 Tax=Streptomyces fradiae TaxID=1906 RepID=A0ACC4WC82_STRFR|nr:hypothetical protein ADZ36_11795 [Streptomyces fradiae]OFA56500.1 hypothetical protein BEN35_06000 [Streptomyces fradiae]RNC73913.1 hypothetical protein DC095_013720 [Streptomyces xinghaiensis]
MPPDAIPGPARLRRHAHPMGPSGAVPLCRSGALPLGRSGALRPAAPENRGPRSVRFRRVPETMTLVTFPADRARRRPRAYGPSDPVRYD